LKKVVLLRAYGDFIVALHSLLNSPNIGSFELIASLHHRPLFEALPASLFPATLQIRFVDFGIKSSMLRVFTNRHILNWQTITEVKNLTHFFKQNTASSDNYFIENSHRKGLLEWVTGFKFKSIAGQTDVYKSYYDFFKSAPVKINDTKDLAKKILILPSARIAKRDIPKAVVKVIEESHKDQTVDTAYFRETKNGGLVYNNFTELVHLIEDADYIYGADSLPIHLSCLLKKPHTIVYPEGGSHQFFTPFALEHQAYLTFN
jgi:ADP-heptose:LPS heptosyltransferase